MKIKNLVFSLCLLLTSITASSARDHKPFVKLNDDNRRFVKLKANKEEFQNGSTKAELNIDESKTGSAFKYYRNGLIKEESNFKNGVLHGVQKKYHESGNLKYSLNYTDGKLDGDQLYFHRNGNLKKKIPYINGVKEGIEKKYDRQGILSGFKQYLGGRKQRLKNQSSLAAQVGAIGVMTAGVTGLALLQNSLNNQRCTRGVLVRRGNRCICQRRPRRGGIFNSAQANARPRKKKRKKNRGQKIRYVNGKKKNKNKVRKIKNKNRGGRKFKKRGGRKFKARRSRSFKRRR